MPERHQTPGRAPSAAGLATSIRRLFSAVLFGLVAAAILPLSSTVAYIGENPYIVKLSASTRVSCAEPVTISAKVRSSDTGDPAIGQIVLWDLEESMSPDDQVDPSETVTDSAGRTSAVLTFGPAEGERTVRVDIATWPTTIRVKCAGGVAVVSPGPSSSSSPTPSATAAASPTISPSPTPTAAPTATPSPAPTPAVSSSTEGGGLTAAFLPIVLVLVVAGALGGLFLFARRR